MNILLTGGSGFIGRNLLPRLLDDGHRVWIIGRTPLKRLPKRCRFIKADISDEAILRRSARRMSRKFDACIHLAGHTDLFDALKSPVKDLYHNAFSVVNLLSIFSIGRFIYISTGSIYDGCSGKVSSFVTKPEPRLPYSLSKYIAELYLKSFYYIRSNPRQYLILRLFNPYGPGQNSGKFIPRTILNFGIHGKKSIDIYGSGKAIIDPIFIDDCVDAIIKALYAKTTNKAIDICSGKPLTLYAFAGKVASVFGIKPKIRCVGDSAEEMTFYADPAPAKKLLNFRPKVCLKDGIRIFADFLQNEGKGAR